MCWKHEWIELKNLEKTGRRLEGLEILAVMREFLDDEARPRLETAGEHLSRAGFRTRVRVVDGNGASAGRSREGLLLEIQPGRRTLVSPSLWFRVMIRPEPALAVLYSQSFGGEHEEGLPLGLTAPARLDTQLQRFLGQGELRGG